jgi:hypothetical protein
VGARRLGGGGRVILTVEQLRALAAAVGFPDPAMAAAVAMVESFGHTDAENVVTNPAPGQLPEQSYGLWQINVLANPAYTPAALYDPTTNARAALALSKGGTSWAPWYTTVSSGAYKKYLPPGYVAPSAWGATPPARGGGALALLGGGLLGAATFFAGRYALARFWVLS